MQDLVRATSQNVAYLKSQLDSIVVEARGNFNSAIDRALDLLENLRSRQLGAQVRGGDWCQAPALHVSPPAPPTKPHPDLTLGRRATDT